MKECMAYKFRIYPDKEQSRLFRRTVGCCRLVYNLSLEQKISAWKADEPVSLSKVDQIKGIADLKEKHPFLREVPHHCLQQAVIDLHKGYENFFARRASYPKPRRKFHNESFRFPDPKQIKIRD